MGEIESYAKNSLIAHRIGPIFDPAFLKIISQEKLKEIVVIQLEAQTRAMREELNAVEAITKMVKEIKVK